MNQLNTKPPVTSKRAKRRERQRNRYKQWFHQHEVEHFIRAEYPACPELAVVYFATHICNVPKNWRDASIADAVAITIQNELRHQQTEYDQLMLVGVGRKEARRRVQPKIDTMITGWQPRLANRSSTPQDTDMSDQ